MFKRTGSKVVLPDSLQDERVLVLFVHGLTGSKKSWEEFSYQLYCTSEIQGIFDIRTYEYPTKLVEVNFLMKRLPNIQTIADGLRSYIKHNCKQYKHIILACHSMGGLIARRYILNQVKFYKDEEVKVKSIILFATPNQGSDVAKVGFLNPWNSQVRQLRSRSEFIEDLNTDWNFQSMNQKVEMRYVVAGQDRLVNRQSAMEYWGNPYVSTNISKNHQSVIVPTSSEDISLRVVVEKIEEIYYNSLGVEEEEDEDEELDYGVEG